MYFHHNTVGPMPNSQIENIERGREKDLRQQYKTHRFIYIQKKHHFFKHLLRENCLRDDCCAKDKWLNELYQIAEDLRSEIFDGDRNLVAHSSHPNLSFVWINFHFSVIYLYFLVCLFSFCTHFKPNASRQREWKKKKKQNRTEEKVLHSTLWCVCLHLKCDQQSIITIQRQTFGNLQQQYRALYSCYEFIPRIQNKYIFNT